MNTTGKANCTRKTSLYGRFSALWNGEEESAILDLVC
jgi:hypothetical protein